MTCRCGHGRELHVHYSSSVHCASCGCERYRRGGHLMAGLTIAVLAFAAGLAAIATGSGWLLAACILLTLISWRFK